MILGREKELAILKEAALDNRSRFIAVYGRRRIGKTFLIREAFGYRFTFQHAGLSKGGMREQIFAFESSIRDAGGTFSEKSKNWLEAFEDLKELIRTSREDRKIILLMNYHGWIHKTAILSSRLKISGTAGPLQERTLS